MCVAKALGAADDDDDDDHERFPSAAPCAEPFAEPIAEPCATPFDEPFAKFFPSAEDDDARPRSTASDEPGSVSPFPVACSAAFRSFCRWRFADFASVVSDSVLTFARVGASLLMMLAASQLVFNHSCVP